MKTELESRDETVTRVKLLKRAYKACRKPIRRKRLKSLFQLLESSLDADCPHPTLASDVFANSLREGEVNLVEQALADYDAEQIRVFHAVLARWAFPANTLLKFDPERFEERFRYHVRECSADATDGFLLARVHGEYEPNSDTIWPHFHGVAAGGMVPVLRKLKRRYRDLDGRTPPRTKIKICRLRDRKQIDYIFQSFWPSRYRGSASNDEGKVIRQRKKGRMSEPYHSMWMLLMDKTKPYDLIIVMGNVALSRSLRSHYHSAIKNALSSYADS